MYTLELAQIENIQIYNEIINDGRLFQKEQGFLQWTEDYPNIDTIREDIHKKRGYALKVNDNISGYMCIDFQGDPAYDSIEGKWRTQGPYVVVHRMAISKDFRGNGIASIAFQLVEEICKHNNIGCIRIDTHFPNKRMQHILKKNGFEECGIVTLQSGRRVAFDKLL